MNIILPRRKAGRVTAVADYKDMALAPYGYAKGERFFHANVPLNKKAVRFKELKGKDGVIGDYLDVKVEGYASTFRNIDRDGESFEPGAFSDSIADFMKNPVMLANHRNACEYQAGSFDEVREDNTGLWVRGTLSNSPEVQHLRFLVAEGHLKTFSVAGMFRFDETGVRIVKAYLWEISLIPIPANPRAIFEAITANAVSAKGAEDDEQENPKGGITIRVTNPPAAAFRGGLNLAGIRVR